jgi:chorismate dehydratase
LVEGRFDVAMIPSIEYFRNPGFKIVSDACIACDGPVQSVKLFSRVPIERVGSIAIDEGSRTSAAMAQILLREQFALDPRTEPLAMGAPLSGLNTDAVLLIGDRAMRPLEGPFERVWDLGEAWCRWTGLPFVFAMWTARPEVDLNGLDRALAAARDAGTDRLEEIARREAPRLGISLDRCRDYLVNRLRFRLGERERRGLVAFWRLAARHGLAPEGGELVFYDHQPA